jgi:SWI/SNF-related matrix-associated actin-dependent regulator of chromatin subfamily A3
MLHTCLGMVGPGEEVIIEREPQNTYDANAIQVLNIGRAKLGHLSRQVAAKLAPLLDRGLVSVEGVVHEGNRRPLRRLQSKAILT